MLLEITTIFHRKHYHISFPICMDHGFHIYVTISISMFNNHRTIGCHCDFFSTSDLFGVLGTTLTMVTPNDRWLYHKPVEMVVGG